eukprot:1841872-Prymnesium_polylepis.1
MSGEVPQTGHPPPRETGFSREGAGRRRLFKGVWRLFDSPSRGVAYLEIWLGRTLRRSGHVGTGMERGQFGTWRARKFAERRGTVLQRCMETSLGGRRRRGCGWLRACGRRGPAR